MPYTRMGVRHKQFCTRVDSGGQKNCPSPCPDRGSNPESSDLPSDALTTELLPPCFATVFLEPDPLFEASTRECHHFLMSPTCLESQGCQFDPTFLYLLSCSSALYCRSFCLIPFLLLAHSPDIVFYKSPFSER